MTVLQALVVAGFVLVHISAGKLRLLDRIPRSSWLSTAGGISVAYVFIHVFPELAKAQTRIGEGWRVVPFLEYHAYFVALCGLAVFYGLERMVKSSQASGERREAGREGETTSRLSVFWIHISSFAVYNALIGYLLVHREEEDLRGLLFFSVAMGLHFLVNDYGLRQDHRNTYHRLGRWVLMAAILIGWWAGLSTGISGLTTGVLFAFLAGGVVLNVLKEELPEERQSRFSAFILGAAGYAFLLLLP